MIDLNFVCFVNSNDDAFAAIVALRSLQSLGHINNQPLVFTSQEFIDQFTEEYPDFNLFRIYKRFNAKLIAEFQKGYNPKLGFRNVMSLAGRRIGESPMLFFSPYTVFLNRDFSALTDHSYAIARMPDDFWPEKQLYGPSLDDMWGAVVATGGGKIEEWLDETQPEGYWRRYPSGSPHLLYAEKAIQFTKKYFSMNKRLMNETPEELAGQSETYPEASAVAAIVRLHGKIIDPDWDSKVIAYRDFYDLMLRLNDRNRDRIIDDIVGDNNVRRIFKNIEEFKVIFYQRSLEKIRLLFDDYQSEFSIQRMQDLIRRRRIRYAIRNRLKMNQSDLEGDEYSLGLFKL